MFKLYKEHKVNPLGGCWPMLLPMPVLFALFFVFQNAIELRGASFLWLPDLSRPDPLYIIPVLMGASMYFLTKVGQMGMEPNPQMKMMLYMMPLMMTGMFLFFPSGLNLYYTVSNIASIPQQWLLGRERMKRTARAIVDVKTERPPPAKHDAGEEAEEGLARGSRSGVERPASTAIQPAMVVSAMLSDPIVALATPPGRSALAVVRVSGLGAFDVAARVVEGFRTDRPRVATLATFHHDGEPIDRGLYTVFPGPHSYTGEDMVELSCHGGQLAPARLLAALHAAGARHASPGEFTRRAVLNGKLDLVQAEAVGELIDAAAPAQARAALHQLDGGLSRRIAELRESLVELQALLSYEIDFPGEDDGPVPAGSDRRGRGGRPAPGSAASSRPLRRRTGMRQGALLVLAGRPNAGKSSLFNALLGTDRALVTEIPGTTRDAIEAHTDFLGWPVRLVDTAGLADAEDRLERMGIEVSRRYLSAADLVLLCVESGRGLDGDEAALAGDRASLVVRTKRDLANGAAEGLAVSSVTGEGHRRR